LIGDQGENLVFLLSMPRSGSTMLSMMLGNHPQICCPPEPWIVLAAAELFGLGRVGDIIYGREWAGIAAIEFLLNAEKKKRGVVGKVFRAVGESSQMDSVQAVRHVLREAYQSYLDVSGKIVFVDKTPRYYMVLDLIDRLFPASRKIVLLRNPLDIYSSYIRTWQVSRGIFTAEGVSDHTRDFCEGLFKFADYIAMKNDLVYRLYYEDLIRNTADELLRLCRFVDLEFVSGMISYHTNQELVEEYKKTPVGDPFAYERSFFSPSQARKGWEKSLEKEDVQSLIDVLGVNIFERLGYGESVSRLNGMRINIPSETRALERRNLLMRSLIENVKEPPFSAWDNFVSSLKDTSSDRHMDRVKQELNTAKARLAQLYASNSWKITKPFRLLRRYLSVGINAFRGKKQ